MALRPRPESSRHDRWLPRMVERAVHLHRGMKVIYATFPEVTDARAALNQLLERFDVPAEHAHVHQHDIANRRLPAAARKPTRGAIFGGLTGAAIGVLGGIAAGGLFAWIGGPNPIIEGYADLALALGAAGAGFGTLAGALAGSASTHTAIDALRQRLKAGEVLLTAQADADVVPQVFDVARTHDASVIGTI